MHAGDLGTLVAVLGKPPRDVEITNDREYDSLSMWESLELGLPWCIKYPKIGKFIAELELPDQDGGPFHMKQTGEPGHWSVRGEPEAFLP